jgi:hypothetical protein
MSFIPTVVDATYRGDYRIEIPTFASFSCPAVLAGQSTPSGSNAHSRFCRGFVQLILSGRSRELAAGVRRALARLPPDRVLIVGLTSSVVCP